MMPGCVLRVCGTSFDPDAFLQGATLRPYTVWHRGEPQAKVGPWASRVHEHAGFCCDVSDVDGDLRGQLKDAEAFLKRYQDDLTRLAALATVEECQLDFGFTCRLGDAVVVQGEYLPVSFLLLAGQLKVAVALSLYPAMSPDVPEGQKRGKRQ